jgi:hydrogenase nickel incorporation protein HypA/HybF
MHELPITESIVRICSEEAKKHNVKKVNEIKIKVGELSGLVPECLQSYFDIVSKDTIIQGAKLNIIKIPIIMECTECRARIELQKAKENCCAVCGSTKLKMVNGNEYYIDSMEVDEDGD